MFTSVPEVSISVLDAVDEKRKRHSRKRGR
jgi:hypothetical protein